MIPHSHEIVLSPFHNLASALDIDVAGGRLIAGSYDANVRIWDFSGMSSDFRPFKTFSPSRDHHVTALSFNKTKSSLSC